MNIRMFGLRFNRRFEWLALVKAEGRRVGWGSVLVSVAKAARIATVGRSVWRQRMRDCAACPIYDRRRHACRNGKLGCGCWMPLKAMFRGPQCWGRSVLPDGAFGQHRWEVLGVDVVNGCKLVFYTI